MAEPGDGGTEAGATGFLLIRASTPLPGPWQECHLPKPSTSAWMGKKTGLVGGEPQRGGTVQVAHCAPGGWGGGGKASAHLFLPGHSQVGQDGGGNEKRCVWGSCMVTVQRHSKLILHLQHQVPTAPILTIQAEDDPRLWIPASMQETWRSSSLCDSAA